MSDAVRYGGTAAGGPGLGDVRGFALTAVKAGIKASGNLDLGLIVADKPAAAAGVFTKSKVVSPAVRVSRQHLKQTGGRARAVLVNAGCANTCTGIRGRKDAEACAKQVAERVGCTPREILICSTGIIGKHLPMEKMRAGIDAAHAQIGRSDGLAFSRAILTTDLRRKTAGVRLPDGSIISGAAKGSGMIAPNMATMLSFVLTDAAVAPEVLQEALVVAVNDSFNCVTVDSDTSTNDTLLVLASGASKSSAVRRASGRNYGAFLDGLREVCVSLAEQVAGDGEGATKLVRVSVVNARSDRDARKAARTIADSPLVKTALYGNDPNWGRILAAAGRSGAALQENKVRLTVAGHVLFQNGAPAAFDAPTVSAAMKAEMVDIVVDLGLGKSGCRMMTCDFSYDYVKINAEYHT